VRLMAKYGKIFKLTLPVRGDAVFLADPEMIEEVLMQPDIFQKLHMKKLGFIRDWFGDGLFTSDDDEESWAPAHRILIPAFSNNSMKDYLLDVDDVTEILVEYLDKHVEENPNKPLDIGRLMEKYTFDVIGKIGFRYDFNAIVSEEMHPYLQNLEEASPLAYKLGRMSFIDRAMGTQKALLKEWNDNNKSNIEFIDRIVAERNQEILDGKDLNRKDLLTLMLTKKDPKTNEGLSIPNVRNQIMTFLFAGHDSTSTSLTNLFFLLSMYPDVERKVYEEVVSVIGLTGKITWEKLSKLKYTMQVVNEGLRFMPPASGFQKECTKDTVVGGYQFKKGVSCIISTWGVAHNEEIWEDPWRFDPDRWTEEEMKKRNSFSSVPFSFGARGCLGKQLSLIEQRVAVVYVIRRFSLRLHCSSNVSVWAPLFAKYRDIYLSIGKRDYDSKLYNSLRLEQDEELKVNFKEENNTAGTMVGASGSMGTTISSELANKEIIILYGSNMGTSEDFATRLQAKATQLGIKFSTILTLDDFLTTIQQDVSFITKNKLFVIITSTYNGNPPDNASEFANFISQPQLSNDIFQNLEYCVFGCGNKLWDRTYQAFPTYVNEKLESLGASRILEQFKGNADQDIDDDFQNFMTAFFTTLCPDMNDQATAENFEPKYEITMVKDKGSVENMSNLISDLENRHSLHNVTEGGKTFKVKVLENRELVRDTIKAGRSVRHIEFELPNDSEYRTGDHLVAYGWNQDSIVEKAGSLLGYNGNRIDDLIMVKPAERCSDTDKKTLLSGIIPFNLPVKISTILSRCVELQSPATRFQISYLANKAMCPPEAKKLSLIAGRNNENDKNDKNNAFTYEEYILKPRRTLLELLEEYKSVQLSFADFITVCTPMKARYYSISSSSLAQPKRASITVGVVEGETLTGRHHYGTCSYHLSTVEKGRVMRCLIKDTGSTFRLPADTRTPIIMVGPGTGIAPLMGFLQERAKTNKSNMDNCMLFFGCRSENDYLYKNELQGYNLKHLHVAFSRKQGQKKTYVQHLIEKQSKNVFNLLSQGAYIYVCGDASQMAPDVQRAFTQVIMKEGNVSSIEEAQLQINQMLDNGRYCQDVWASA